MISHRVLRLPIQREVLVSPQVKDSSLGYSFGVIALAGGFGVYGLLKVTMGIRLTQEEEYRGADLSIHKISANAEENKF